MSETFAARVDRNGIVTNLAVITREMFDTGILDEPEWVFVGDNRVLIGRPLPPFTT